MGVEYNQPAHLLDRYIKGVILTVVDCTAFRAFATFFPVKILFCTSIATYSSSDESTMQIISITVQCKPECLYLVTLKKNLKSLLAMKHVTVLTNLCHCSLPLDLSE